MKTIAPEVGRYIASFPEETQDLLLQMRKAIYEEVPEATETIGYGIPTFKLNGNLVHYAGYKHHIGFYPGAGAIVDFAKEFSVYKNAKGSVQFPIGQPMPLSLVKKVVRYRVKQNQAKPVKKTTVKNVPGQATKLSGTNAVDQYLQLQSMEVTEIVNVLRKAILTADKHIAEQIKWNSPAFYYAGEMSAFNAKEYKRDLAVFNLSKGRIMLVFPTGDRIDDPSGLLQGDYKDGRRIITYNNLKEAKESKKALQQIVRDWVGKVEG